MPRLFQPNKAKPITPVFNVADLGNGEAEITLYGESVSPWGRARTQDDNCSEGASGAMPFEIANLLHWRCHHLE